MMRQAIATKKRGRPRLNNKSDTVIANTVEHLLWWGFAGNEIFEVVGKAAYDILKRGDSNKLPLGPDRVKQIYKLHALKKGRKQFTKKSLRDRCPNKYASINDLALTLLSNNGDWPKKSRPRYWPPSVRRFLILGVPVILPVYHDWIDSIGPGDMELTPKAEREHSDYPRPKGQC